MVSAFICNVLYVSGEKTASSPFGKSAVNVSISPSSLIVEGSICAGVCEVFLKRLSRLIEAFADSENMPGRFLGGSRV